MFYSLKMLSEEAPKKHAASVDLVDSQQLSASVKADNASLPTSTVMLTLFFTWLIRTFNFTSIDVYSTCYT